MIRKSHIKKICFAAIAALLLGSSLSAQEELGESQPPAAYGSDVQNHFLDLGVGLGLDYGGIFGVKLAYIFPWPHISIFTAVGAQTLGVGWSVGTTFHILAENSNNVFRPNVKIMYGVNRSIMVTNTTGWDKMYTGLTPGIGLEFMFGRKKANGFDFDLNFPIGSSEFNSDYDRMKNDPEITGQTPLLPVAFSLGYHHEF